MNFESQTGRAGRVDEATCISLLDESFFARRPGSSSLEKRSLCAVAAPGSNGVQDRARGSYARWRRSSIGCSASTRKRTRGSAVMVAWIPGSSQTSRSRTNGAQPSEGSG